jgi:O-antigen ligase
VVDLRFTLTLIPALVAFGVVLVVHPRVAVAGVAALTLGLIVTARGSSLFTDLFLFAIGGALILGYGFANVGIGGALPVPVVDLSLVVLATYSLATLPRRGPSVAVMWLATLFVAVAVMRLYVDFPRWRADAVRDFTLAAELAFLPVGYRVGATFERDRIVNWFGRIMLLAVAYLALYPVRDVIAAHSPVVGLQQPVPLLGNYSGAVIVATLALFFFLIVRPIRRSSLCAAVAAVFIVMLQSRGAYVAIPAAGLLVFLFARSARGRMLAGFGVIAVAAAAVFIAAPTGRLGSVSPQFALSQLRTLTGATGPGAGTLDDRQVWVKIVQAKVDATPHGWFWGVGLGPDLTNGFRSSGSVSVRKPHNDFLEMYGRMGVLGLGLFCAAMLTALARIVAVARVMPDDDARFAWWVVASAISILILSATQPMLAYPYATVPLFSLLGIGLARADRYAFT